MQFALAAAKEALDNAQWDLSSIGRGHPMSEYFEAMSVGSLSIY